MRKVIILIILSVILSGCNPVILDINNFVMPDDLEFLEVVENLDTPAKIGSYMWLNFIYEYHPYGVLTPYQLYKGKKGDCNDFSYFGTYIAHYHGYAVWQIRITYKDSKINHWLGVYKEGDFYTYTDNQSYCVSKYNNFLDIVNMYCLIRDKNWIRYEVYDYEMNIVETGFN